MMQKAYLSKLDSNSGLIGEKIIAQFNPQSLRVSYRSSGTSSSAQKSGGAAGGPGGTDSIKATVTNQDTGFSGTLDVELLFDTTETGENVQIKTRQILELLQPEAANHNARSDNGTTVPFIRFQCGTFIFDGRLNSFNETLDYFSEEGKPLRSTVSLNMSTASPQSAADSPNGTSGANAAGGLSASLSLGASAQISASGSLSGSIGASASFQASAGVSVGAAPLTIAQGGESIQSVAARAGVDWRVAASINGIDNPRQLQAGAVLNLRTR